MKKFAVIIAVALLMGILLQSCKTAEDCPAYGESRKFKVEKGY